MLMQVPHPGMPLRRRGLCHCGRRPQLRNAVAAREWQGQRRSEECAASKGGSEDRVVFDFDFDGVESSNWILDLPAIVDGPKEASWRLFKEKSTRLIITPVYYVVIRKNHVEIIFVSAS